MACRSSRADSPVEEARRLTCVVTSLESTLKILEQHTVDEAEDYQRGPVSVRTRVPCR